MKTPARPVRIGRKSAPTIRKLAIGIAALGGTLALAAAGAPARTNPCTGVLAGTISYDIAAGPGCSLIAATVKGDVDVVPGGSLTTNHVVVNSNLRIHGPASFSLLNTSVRGGLESMTLEDNTVSAPGQATEVRGNAVSKTLDCQNNSPAPVNAGSPNTARHKLGQCVGL